MSAKSKKNIILPFFLFNASQTKACGENNKSNEINVSENEEEKRREHYIQGRGREYKGIGKKIALLIIK